MPERKIDTKRARKLLKQLDLKRLFVEELNWANPTGPRILIPAGDDEFTLTPIAEQGGMKVFEAASTAGDRVPDRSTRLAVHQKLLEHAQEHILVFVNSARTTTHWVWVERQGGRRVRDYHHRFHVDQPGDSLLQKLEGLAFSWKELDAEGRASIIQVGDKVRAALAVERVTKRFYDEFKAKHKEFLDFIAGIEKLDDRRWYASVMLNRLMFLYFVQKKGFLAGDPDYLENQLDVCRLGGVPFYRGFLVPLFFQGLGMRPEERPAEAAALLGKIPYLDGGLFMPHQIEQENEGIDIPDEAFERILKFFGKYQWHLDDRPVGRDDEINPDVLGYIFEKYINQKEMGAYYTREDITEYITKNTVIPFLFDKLKGFGDACEAAIAPLPIASVEGYLHDALRTGLDMDLPAPVAAGLTDVSRRGCWNQPADDDYRLPTETWREHVARRKRVEQIREDFAAGKITGINDFITYNLDIIAFAHDFLAGISDPNVLHAFYFRCLKQATILDPTCGSGAFLFAALNLLEPLYEISIERIEEFTRGHGPWKQGDPEWLRDFQEELASLARHPSRPYFIYKSIIVQNLYGVDIMQEAVEICKLRLFLKLAAQVEPDPEKPNWGIEPLPDIDFNILCGNTLVGYVRLEDIDRLWAAVERDQNGQSAMAFEKDHSKLAELCREYGRMLGMFRDQQLGLPTPRVVRKADVRRAADQEIRPELDKDLWRVYRQGALVPHKMTQKDFQSKHHPLHWIMEFPAVMARGGFDVIVGNPPWVEYAKVRKSDYQVCGFAAEECGNLYALCSERSLALTHSHGRLGFIVQLPLVSSRRMEPLRMLLRQSSRHLHIATFDDRPDRLFPGLEHCRASVFLAERCESAGDAGALVFVTRYNRWYQQERDQMIALMRYSQTGRSASGGVFPKVSGDLAAAVLRKLVGLADAATLATHSVANSPHFVFYQEATQYWAKGYDALPYYEKNGAVGVPPHGRYVYFRTADAAAGASAILNSSTFYLWYILLSDCYHLSDGLLKAFPFPKSAAADARLSEAAGRLRADLDGQAERQTITTKAGDSIGYAKFDAGKSKPIADEIDRILAKHYGFTDEESDFIINYDIKYRMGASAGEEEE